MSVVSADTNLFLYAANPHSPRHEAAAGSFAAAGETDEFVVCEFVLVELYMQLRNAAVLANPLDAAAAADSCGRLRAHPTWQHIDSDPCLST